MIQPTHIEHGIVCNTADERGATDQAMVELVERMGTDMKGIKNKHLTKDTICFPFSSKRKRMSTILENVTGEGYDKRIHIKGASEIVKNCCNSYLNAAGEVCEMTDEMNKQLD